MSHGDAIIDRDGVEFRRKTTLRFDDFLDLLPDFMEMNVSGNELREGIDYGNNLFDPRACHWRARGCGLRPFVCLPWSLHS
jgi:hypothetical protein